MVVILFWRVVLDAVAYRWPRLGRILKAHGLTDVSQVHRAYVEPNGMISVIPRDGEQSTEALPPPPVV